MPFTFYKHLFYFFCIIFCYPVICFVILFISSLFFSFGSTLTSFASSQPLNKSSAFTIEKRMDVEAYLILFICYFLYYLFFKILSYFFLLDQHLLLLLLHNHSINHLISQWKKGWIWKPPLLLDIFLSNFEEEKKDRRAKKEAQKKSPVFYF